jgi:hypothetical protein
MFVCLFVVEWKGILAFRLRFITLDKILQIWILWLVEGGTPSLLKNSENSSLLKSKCKMVH